MEVIVDFEKMLRRLRFKRRLLAENPNATPEDWEALAAEYEANGFVANEAICRTRAKKMMEGLHDNKGMPQLRETAQDDRVLQKGG